MSNNRNKLLLKEFDKLIKQIKHDINKLQKYDAKMYFRLRNIRNVRKIIEEYPKEITSGKQLSSIKGVGNNSVKRINEILKYGKLKEIRVKEKHVKYLQYMEELEQIFGIGRKKSYELVKKYNIKSIKELKKAIKNKNNDLPLTNQIIMGLKYHGKFIIGIVRKEMDMINNYIQSIGRKLDSQLIVIICGSYRRMAKISNDIDVLIVHPKISLKNIAENNYLLKFVNVLKKEKFIIDDLTFEDYKTKYMGFCQFKTKSKIYPVRRIDIKFVPYESYASALLYFTGSKDFNRKMRGIAITQNYKLNEYGLYYNKNGNLIKIKTNVEKDIFDELGMEYVEPHLR